MKVLDRLLFRLRILIDPAVLYRVVYQNGIRLLQIAGRAGAPQWVRHLEPYGYTSHPLPDAEPMVVNLGGRRDRALVLLVNDRRHAIVLAEGETALYTAHGERIHLKKDNSIHVKAATRVLLETPEVECTQDLLVRGNAVIEGNADIGGDATIDGISYATDHDSSGKSGKDHIHPTPSGPSGKPE